MTTVPRADPRHPHPEGSQGGVREAAVAGSTTPTASAGAAFADNVEFAVERNVCARRAQQGCGSRAISDTLP
jgi:hypothetical protein